MWLITARTSHSAHGVGLCSWSGPTRSTTSFVRSRTRSKVATTSIPIPFASSPHVSGSTSCPDRGRRVARGNAIRGTEGAMDPVSALEAREVRFEQTVDVVVVGLGVAGASAAVAARQAGADVLAVERSGGPGGTSANSGGLIYL